MTRIYRTLSEELAELERTNPAVKAAADHYDFVVWRMNRKAERRRSAERLVNDSYPKVDDA